MATALLVATPATALAAPPGLAVGHAAGRTPTAGRQIEGQGDASALAAARAAASAGGTRVEVVARRTETSTTWANPDGSLTTELSAGPIRFKRNGKWTPIDVNLRRSADGGVEPTAVPDQLRFSGGGGKRPGSMRAAQQSTAQDLVTLGEGDRKLTLQWKGGLPVPQLDGTKATYVDAVPGADVVVDATRTGFEQYVAIKRRPTTDGYAYTLPLKADGLTATRQNDGSVLFTDAKGFKRAVMPAPVMWDSTTDKVSGEHTRRAKVGLKVVKDGTTVDLVFTPDPAFLASPATHYPVTVDPSTSALGNAFDTYVQQGETGDLSTDVELDLGNPGTTNTNGTPRTARSFITWNTTPIANALVSSATLSLWDFHSGNTGCAAQEWDVWATGKPATSSRWTAQPTWNTKYASSTQTKGNTACAAAGWITADVTNLAQIWASSQAASSNMGLRATDESTSQAWKRVNSANAPSNPPKLSVTYNYRPQTGTNRRAGPPYLSYSGSWVVNTLTPTLQDTFVDPDGDTVDGTFQIYDTATNAQVGDPLVSPFVASGTPASVKVPAGVLVTGKTYEFRTDPYDGTHYNTDWSPWTTFTVDTAPPPPPATVTSTDYPKATWTANTGHAAAFSVTPASTDLNWLEWSFDSGVWTRISTGASASPVTVTVPPPANGWHTLHTRTVDKADNTSVNTDYTFGIGSASLTAPAGPTTSDGSALTLAATSAPGLTSVRYQYRLGTSGDYTDIPAGDITNAGGALASWPATTATDGSSPDLTWAIGHSLPADGTYQLRALFSDPTGATLATAPVTVTLTRHTTPGAPNGLVLTPADGTLQANWAAPADDGGSPVTGYTITTTQGANTVGTPITVAAGTLTTTITGLTNGTTYTVSVTAVNAAGTGATATATGTPRAPAGPSVPTGVTVIPGSSAATITWQAPSDSGDTALASTTVEIHRSADDALAASTTVQAPATTATLTGLTTGDTYYAVLWATNTGGVQGSHATTEPFTIVATEPPRLTGLGVWKTTDSSNGTPLICVLWRINGTHQEEFSGRIHFQLAPTSGGTPDAATDWSLAYDPTDNLVPGSNGEYSWCGYGWDVPASTTGTQWTPVALTADDQQGDTLQLSPADLSGATITDPDGDIATATFTNPQ